MGTQKLVGVGDRGGYNSIRFELLPTNSMEEPIIMKSLHCFSSFIQLRAIATLTFKQSIRQPLYLVLTLTALALIGMQPFIAIFTFHDHLKLVADGGLATLIGFGWIIGVFCAHECLNQDIANNAITLIVAKPVKKSTYFLAKQMGLLAALCLYFILTAIGMLAALRIARDQFDIDWSLALIYYGGLIAAGIGGGLKNYYTRKSFSASTIFFLALLFLGLVFYLFQTRPDYAIIGKESSPAFGLVFKTLILILMPILVMGVFSAICSPHCNLVMNLGVCSLIFGVGLVSDYFFNVDGNVLAWALHAVIPNWQLFWMTDALSLNHDIPLSYCLTASGYGLFLIFQFNLIAWLVFRKMEPGNPVIH
jgi:hypothetical protein